MLSLGERLSHAWDAFMNRSPTESYESTANASFFRPDRVRLNYGNDRTIITAVYNRIAVDCAAIDIRHVRVDENGRYLEGISSKLNRCFSIEANNDQTGRNLIQDIVLTMFDEGCVAVVPVQTSFNPEKSQGYEIEKIRAGKIVEWYPEKIKVELYNEKIAKKQCIIVKKDNCAIIENPFYSIMNAPNGILRRLTRKLAVLDTIDDKSCSGKLDMIIQLPYTLKSDLRKQQAEVRRKELEDQMNSKLGIAYTDATEKIVQLNRPLENNLMTQIEYLTRMLYSQLGDEEIFSGKANEQMMQNYYTHTVEPIMVAITEEFTRKFLSKTAITQGQTIKFFRDTLKLLPLNSIADMGDKFTRNEIMTSNEVRSLLGMKPSQEPSADELRNKALYPMDQQGYDDQSQYYDQSQDQGYYDDQGNQNVGEYEEE